VVARAQQPAMPVIGFLSPQSAEVDYKNVTVPFLQGLKEAGFVGGRDVAVEYRYAENQALPGLQTIFLREGRCAPVWLVLDAYFRCGNSPVAYNGVSWSRLSEQLFRVDKWSVCRG
jgi:hypothetical protein